MRMYGPTTAVAPTAVMRMPICVDDMLVMMAFRPFCSRVSGTGLAVAHRCSQITVGPTSIAATRTFRSGSRVMMSTRSWPPSSRPLGPNMGSSRIAASRTAGSEFAFISFTTSATVLPLTFSGHLMSSFFSAGLPGPGMLGVPGPGGAGTPGPGAGGIGFLPLPGSTGPGPGLGSGPPGGIPGFTCGGSLTCGCADPAVKAMHKAATSRPRPRTRGVDMEKDPGEATAGRCRVPHRIVHPQGEAVTPLVWGKRGDSSDLRKKQDLVWWRRLLGPHGGTDHAIPGPRRPACDRPRWNPGDRTARPLGPTGLRR